MALSLLMMFAAECIWVAERCALTDSEQDHIWAGRQQIEAGAVPRHFRYSPLVNLAAAAPLRLDASRVRKDATPERVRNEVRRLRLLTRGPFVVFGIGFGVSLWYVSRRLFGNEGGYLALLLYVLSPAVVLASARIGETIPAAWGIFGVVFVSIALAHNLYAPWRKWRYRTVLLAIAMFMGAASHPVVIVAIVAAVVFPLYLAPGRRIAGVVLMIAAALLAAALLYASYNFTPRAMEYGVYLPGWLKYAPGEARAALLANPDVFLSRFSAAVETLFVISLAIFMVWKRTRYFGNTAPLLIFAIILYATLVTPLALMASVWCLPFLFIFIGGIFADLLETRYRPWVVAALVVLICEQGWLCWWMIAKSGDGAIG